MGSFPPSALTLPPLSSPPPLPFPPFLEEAVDHARRLVRLLEQLDPGPVRRPAQTWLVGRVEEVRCVIDAVTHDWRGARTSTADATRSLNTYIQSLHRGLAVHFGELAPVCCVCSLVVTATPVSLAPAASSMTPVTPRWDVRKTWERGARAARGVEHSVDIHEAPEVDLLEVTVVPGSQ
jgi:hypothetical protein